MVQMSVEQCWLQDKTTKYSSGSTTATASNRAEDGEGEEEEQRQQLQQQLFPHRSSFHHHSATNNSKNNVMEMNNNSKSVEMGLQQQKQTSDNDIGGGSGSVANNVNESLLSDHNDHKQQHEDDDIEEEESATTSKKRPDDPVGDIITNMLNEGSIPYFGYRNYCQQQLHHQQQMTIITEEEEIDKFDWNHILCMRNFRAIRKFIVDSASWMMTTTSTTTDNTTNNGQHRYHRQHNDEGTSSSPSSIIMMRFLQEVFLVQLVMVYSVSDIVLRSTMWFVMLTIMLLVHTLVDIDEIIQGLITLIGSKRASKLINVTDQFRNYWEQMMKTIHTDFLWGDYLEGRTIVWSEEDRLPKFRRKHMTLIRIIKERRENAKSIRRIERESKRTKRKGLIENAAEAVIVDEAKILLLARKGELDTAARELNQKPPTYFPTNVTLENNNKDDEEKEETASSIHQRSDATNGHLEALSFCHRMVFLRDQEAQRQQKYNVQEAQQQLRTEQENDKMLVSIASAGSADNNIEVVSKEINISPSDRAAVLPGSVDDDDNDDNDDSTACSDFPSVGVHYDSDSDGDSVSYDSSVSSSSQALPWLAVGAKIGEKLLKSRKLQRVVANPDEIQKTIPNEALKLIDDMDIPDEVKENATEMLVTRSPSVSKRLEQQREEKRREKEAQQKQDAMKLKHPVHGMWTSPSPVATTPGKVTRVMSPLRNEKTPNSKFPVIEMPTSFNDPSFSSPVPAERPNQTITLFKSTPPIDRQPKKINRLAPIEKGVRIVVPLFSPDPNNSITMNASSFYQMGTVISSRRAYVPSNNPSNIIGHERTNCLIIKLILDKFILRGCRFGEMNLRIMDEWDYTPCHSKFPIGSCVATTFGVGVLVGWRVEDDMHIIRSLWNRSGPGSGVAYLRRDSIHSVVQAAVGFDVETTYGSGKVVGYVKAGKQNVTGKYVVRMQHDTRFIGRLPSRNKVVEFSRFQILSCPGAIFVPVTEHIRAAALYQLELLHYKARVREQALNKGGSREKGTWRNFSEYVDLFAVSFSKAIAEDPDFDREFNKFLSHIISILEGDEETIDDAKDDEDGEVDTANNPLFPSDDTPSDDTVAWTLQDIFKCIWAAEEKSVEMVLEEKQIRSQTQAFEEAHDTAMILIRVLMRTTILARASVTNRPKLHIALSMIHEGLLLIRQLFVIHKKHTSTNLVQAWFRTINEISATFGPWRQRTAALWEKILEKLGKHGTVAKRRILRFVDICLSDTLLLPALELGDWKSAGIRFEAAIVKSEIADRKTCDQLRKGVKILYNNVAPRKKDKHTKAAAARSGQKAMNLAKVMKIIATPGRSLLHLLTLDDVLDLFDRVLVRVFEKDPVCSMMINIFATQFYSIRHLRYLNNMPISGKLWETVLDAVDEELSFATSDFPEQTQDFIKPFVKLFSLGVSQFHDIQSGAISAEWLDFLLEDESVMIIQELDRRLIDSLDSFCRDVKTIFEVMPYIKTIDNDILNLMDEFDPDLLLRELSDSIGDSEKFIFYIKERTSLLIERFLEYLPKMSIPIERRELEGGWVLTCRGKQGGDLRLSDISMDRENLLCYVLGSDENVLQPLANTLPRAAPVSLSTSFETDTDVSVDDSILEEVRELIVSAQQYNNWVVGVNGIKDPSQFQGIPKPLDDLPLSDTLKAGIDLWQTSAINDFELLEIAIRDVSYQISVIERDGFVKPAQPPPSRQPSHVFNPKVDPTVLFLDIKNLSMNLNEFTFRVEKKDPSIFDPVFEGGGSIMVKNLSLALKVEIKKERVKKNGVEIYRPVFHLTTLDVGLQKLKIVFAETGADWILNSVLKGFRRQTSEIVEAILKEQITQQVHNLLESANGFVDANPDVLLVALGISLKDLDESIVSV